MKLPKSLRLLCALLMAALMTNIPHIAWAEMAPQMIPTSVLVNELSRKQAEDKVQSYLNREDIRSELVKRGIDPQEVTERLASLSDTELKQLSTQMDAAMYGGDVVGILVIVVLVLLVIFLAKRI